MNDKLTANEYQDGSGTIRLGDKVKVTAVKPGGRLLDAVVREIVLDGEGEVKEVTVITSRNNAWRTFYPSRIRFLKKAVSK